MPQDHNCKHSVLYFQKLYKISTTAAETSKAGLHSDGSEAILRKVNVFIIIATLHTSFGFVFLQTENCKVNGSPELLRNQEGGIKKFTKNQIFFKLPIV